MISIKEIVSIETLVCEYVASTTAYVILYIYIYEFNMSFYALLIFTKNAYVNSFNVYLSGMWRFAVVCYICTYDVFYDPVITFSEMTK